MLRQVDRKKFQRVELWTRVADCYAMRTYDPGRRRSNRQEVSPPETTASLAARVWIAERAAEMTASELQHAGIKFIEEIRERLDAYPDRPRRAAEFDSCIREALLNRLRAAVELKTERERSAWLHRLLGLSET